MVTAPDSKVKGGEVSLDQVAQFQKAFDADPRNRQSMNAVCTTTVTKVALNRRKAVRNDMTFSVHLPENKITSQNGSGRCWMFAALNTVEPPIVERSMAAILERDKPWYGERLTILDERVRVRLRELSIRLGDADWLEGEFNAGDLLMVTVLRRLDGSGLVEEFPNLTAFVARGEARPAYRRAFDAQLAVFQTGQGNSRG
jgi:hypothetical protein